jgi:hypothetical protein
VSHNVISDYGIWDKQSAAYHKALSPGNTFESNICFNASRHGVNFQDSVGGAKGSVISGNVFFNLNRETSDTSALNSWGRRNYVISDSAHEPEKPRLMPVQPTSWERNLILNRNYYGVRDGNGNALRCDDGASWYNMSSNVMYNAGMEFNGGTQVFTHRNLFIHSGWTSCASPPDYGGGAFDTYIDSAFQYESICGMDKCAAFWQPNVTNHTAAGNKPAIFLSDYNTFVVNSTGRQTQTPSKAGANTRYYCGLTLAEWQAKVGQDKHTRFLNGSNNGAPQYTPEKVLAYARRLLWQ